MVFELCACLDKYVGQDWAVLGQLGMSCRLQVTGQKEETDAYLMDYRVNVLVALLNFS